MTAEAEGRVWEASWITRPVQDHRSWNVHVLEVRASMEPRGSAGILFAVRDGDNCRVCELDAENRSVILYALEGGRRREWARADAPELGGGRQGEEAGTPPPASGPNEEENRSRPLHEASVRIVQEAGGGIRVCINGRQALAFDPSTVAEEAAPQRNAQTENVSGCGTVGFRTGPGRTAVFRELRVFDADGRALYVNRFYDPSVLHFEGGRLDPSGSGLRLAPGETALCLDPLPVDNPLFRRAFDLPVRPAEAKLRVYALGWYELSLNGRRIGDRVLAPANTPYEQRLLFDTYESEELLELLREGENVLGASLGGGYNFNYSRWGWKWKRDKAFILQLDLTLEDGSRMVLGTDESWMHAPGPLLLQDMYDGETYDARRLPKGWDKPGFVPKAAEGWTGAAAAAPPEAGLEPNGQPPVRTHAPLEPVRVYRPEPGITVYDFGQNVAGWARIEARGQAGDRVVLTYSELIDGEGRIDPWTNRNARARDEFILSGEGTEHYEPRFTYHGFRYVEVRGTAKLSSIRAVPVRADVKASGMFRCSDPLLERIQDNIRRSILNNLVSIPTDCCQRDERTPCLMDSAVVEEAAIHNFDMKAYYRKWMGDIAGSDSNPDWSGDRVTLPWHLYRHYGDLAMLREGYPSMKAYLEYLEGRWPGHIVTEGFGDWCPPNDDGWENYFGEPELVNTALYAMQAGVAAEAAETLGYGEDALRFRALAAKVRAAFHARFHRGEGIYGSGSQTAQLLPLAFGLVDAELAEGAVRALIGAIEASGRHLDTGIYGTRYLLDVLADHGCVDLAYELLTTESYPGFGWQIEQGATTLWEQWSFKGGMHSHDHAMFGGIGASFYTRLAGITPLEPGYARIGIRPHVPAGLEWAEAELDTPAGRIRSAWRREEKGIAFEIDIPEGALAEASLPAGAAESGRKSVALVPGKHEFTALLALPNRA